MVKFLRIVLRTIEVVAIVLLLFLGSLAFREQSLPASWVCGYVANQLPANFTLRLESVTFGFRRGLRLTGLSVVETLPTGERELAGAEVVLVDPFARRLVIDGARYPRLPDSYYAPGNQERNAPVVATLPALGEFELVLNNPSILAVTPEWVSAKVEVTPKRLAVRNIYLEWPDTDEHRSLNGYCTVDFNRQLIEGEVHGQARQAHIRPLIVALDVPVSLPYMDGFTEVPGSVPSACAWHVNLVNNDFDLDLDLKPTLGKYNSVPLKSADGKLHLHVYTRGQSLNYRHTFGPIHGEGFDGQTLDGTVKVSGTNGYNTVEVAAKSKLPIAQLLKIGGFVDDYVGSEVIGDAEGTLEFRFPRAMTNNYEVLNGRGSVTITNGHLMRMKGFKGLLDAMPAMAPGISWFSDTTRASGSYVIDNGVLKTDDFYLEGTLFSIKMYGRFDAVRNTLNFTARVQFTRKDTVIGKILHPLAWPFTKLLLEFKLTGTPQSPTWTYCSVIHRLIEVAE